MRGVCILQGLSTLLLAVSIYGCSNFCLPSKSKYNIHVRTMDFDSAVGFTLKTFPRGSSVRSSLKEPWAAKYGSLVVVPRVVGYEADFYVVAGMNEEGLSCDSQSLTKPWSKYPKRLHAGKDLSVIEYCTWVLASFKDVKEARKGTEAINVWSGYLGNLPVLGDDEQHFIIRDRFGQGIVVEFIDGKTVIANETLGVVTNEPTYDWHIKNVQHFDWKYKLSRVAVAIPGSFYPDERLLRIHMLKKGLPQPKSFRDAFMHAVHVLNSVTVPMGRQYGTDTGKGSGESVLSDHTQWALIYDHDKKDIYWRESNNQNWRKAALGKAQLAKGSSTMGIILNRNDSPWVQDESTNFAQAQFHPLQSEPVV